MKRSTFLVTAISIMAAGCSTAAPTANEPVSMDPVMTSRSVLADGSTTMEQLQARLPKMLTKAEGDRILVDLPANRLKASLTGNQSSRAVQGGKDYGGYGGYDANPCDVCGSAYGGFGYGGLGYGAYGYGGLGYGALAYGYAYPFRYINIGTLYYPYYQSAGYYYPVYAYAAPYYSYPYYLNYGSYYYPYHARFGRFWW